MKLEAFPSAENEEGIIWHLRTKEFSCRGVNIPGMFIRIVRVALKTHFV